MAKKYLSLEEAASMLGMTTDQVMRARERGDLRGFADRGSWKFREQDIEEFLRSQQTDSSPDIPIITGDSSSVLDDGDNDLSSSDSDVRLFFDDSPFDDGGVKELAQSGSDVRLSGDSGPKLETDGDIDLSGWDSDLKISDSDSDVKLVGAGTEAEIDLVSGKKSDSDSDVRLVDDEDSDVKLFDSDSDVRLAENLAATGAMELSQSDSDSDVKLMGSDDILLDDSDSDVKLSTGLDRTDSDIRLADPSPAPKAQSDVTRTMAMPIMPDDSDLKLLNKGSGTRAGSPDSGISLEVRGSGLNLNSDESGISLELDSGISLEADDSGISLESFDSGAKLGGDDSGITLDAGDSGISLDIDDDGPAVQDMSRTMPMQAIPGAAKAKALSDSSAMTTQFEIPAAVVGKDSEFELAGLDDDEEEVGTNTSVLTFEDDDVDNSRTIAAPALANEGFADDDDSAAAVADDDSYEEEESYDDDGGYEEDMDDVSDAEEFGDDDFESGQSQVGPAAARVGSRADVEWSLLVKVLISFSTVLSVLCAVVGVELVRTMWVWTQPVGGAPSSPILEMLGGMF